MFCEHSHRLCVIRKFFINNYNTSSKIRLDKIFYNHTRWGNNPFSLKRTMTRRFGLHFYLVYEFDHSDEDDIY